MSVAAASSPTLARPDERMDRVGILASTLCAAHCLAAAVLAAAAPALRFIERPELEWGFVLAALSIAGVALQRGRRRHGAWSPLLLAASGASMLVVARLAELPSEHVETAASVAGATLIIAGHGSNLRLLRRLQACCTPSPRVDDAAAA